MAEDPREPQIPAMRPCPFAIAAMTVPSVRWTTRADLMNQLSKAEAYMKECPLDGFSVYDAARECGLSVHHFIRLFRQVYSQTPYQFLSQRRVESAKELLKTGDLSVLEVGFEVGFTNASAFSRTFRKLAGMSPTQYRIRFSNFGTARQ